MNAKEVTAKVIDNFIKLLKNKEIPENTIIAFIVNTPDDNESPLAVSSNVQDIREEIDFISKASKLHCEQKEKELIKIVV